VRGDRGRIIATYSVAVLKSGERSREVMWIDEIEAIRVKSKYPDGGPWKDHYGEMCRKTVARRHSKVLPMSSDLDDLLRRDDDETHDRLQDAPRGDAPPPRSLTDALNMVASLPVGEAPDIADQDAIEHADGPEREPDLIDQATADRGGGKS
jgi:recombination protein RecT